MREPAKTVEDLLVFLNAVIFPRKLLMQDSEYLNSKNMGD
jgi:hypothetical protein